MQSIAQQQLRFSSGRGWPWRSLLVALVIEMLIILGLVMKFPAKPDLPKPVTVQIHMVAPPPQPVAPPSPPKPPLPSVQKIEPLPPKPVAPPPKPARHPVEPVKPHPRQQQPVPHMTHIPPSPSLPALAPKTPAPITVADAGLMDKYVALVRAVVQSNLQIPPQLLALQESGACTLKFTLAPDGQVLSVEITRSSGINLVDQTALNALKRSNLPSFLAGMPQAAHSFSIIVSVSTN